mgnify:CR=1 FL=1
MVSMFKSVRVADAVCVTAPDGSLVDILASCGRGSMARFSLEPGLTSKAVRHKTVEELWYFVAGRGEIWLSDGANEETIEVYPGLSLSIPGGTSFQFRCTGDTLLQAIGVTMPPWPGMEEAESVNGKW